DDDARGFLHAGDPLRRRAGRDDQRPAFLPRRGFKLPSVSVNTSALAQRPPSPSAGLLPATWVPSPVRHRRRNPQTAAAPHRPLDAGAPAAAARAHRSSPAAPDTHAQTQVPTGPPADSQSPASAHPPAAHASP